MALSGRAPVVSLLDQLLEEINFQRTKEMRQLLKDEGGFVVLQGTTQWTDLFVRHFLFAEETTRAIDCDDLLFFVRKRHLKASCRLAPKYETVVEVFRKDSKKLPIGDPEIEWEETVYLNLIVHQFEYTLTLAICTRTSPKDLQVLRRHSTKVYASPSRRKMDSKGDGEEMTYPHICFCVDNFDEVFSDMVVRDGEMVCVELAARGRAATAAAALFLGSVRYDALARVYDCRQSSLSSKVAQRMSFGLLGKAARCEMLRVRGPHGKGHAEVAVWRPKGGFGSIEHSGWDTPASEPGLSYADLCGDWEDDVDPYGPTHRHQRRLSDPSANIVEWARGSGSQRHQEPAMATEGLSARCRSQQDLHELPLDPAQPEVQAGDVRDARRRGRGSASSSGARAHVQCCACVCIDTNITMHDVYHKQHNDAYCTTGSHGNGRQPGNHGNGRQPGNHGNAKQPAKSADTKQASKDDHGNDKQRGRHGNDKQAGNRTDKKKTVIDCDLEGALEAADAASGPGVTVRGREEKPAVKEYRVPTHMPMLRKDKNDNRPMRLKKPKRESAVDNKSMNKDGFDTDVKFHICQKTDKNATAVTCQNSDVKFHTCQNATDVKHTCQNSKHVCDNAVPVVKRAVRSHSCSRLSAMPRRTRAVRAVPPVKTTPDGTAVHYWCDLPRGKTNELDDGAYNPLWGLRGFPQAFSLWKEGRRAQCAPLAAALTYLTLPWWSIAKDILDVREEPILTF